MKWYVKALNQFADFKGRAGRQEFWMFYLFNFLATIAISVIGFGIMSWTEKTGAIVLPLVYTMAVLIPSCAVAVRRLHDTGRSAWFLLIGLFPVVGWIWLLVVLTLRGVPQDNLYGKNPVKTPSSHYFRRRSAAVALIISSFFWLFSCLLIFFISSEWNDCQILSILLPVGMIIIGFMFFSKRMFTAGIASSLIVLSVVWLFRDVLVIRDEYTNLFLDFDILLLISQFVIFVPVAFFLAGIYILIKRTDRTVPACLLFAGSFIWIFDIIWKISQFNDYQYDTSSFLSLLNSIPVLLPLLSNTIVTIVPVSLLVFARTLLSKEKSGKETKYIYDKKSKRSRHNTDRRAEDNERHSRSKDSHRVAHIESDNEFVPISQPDAFRIDTPSAQSEALLEDDPIESQEVISEDEPFMQPEAILKDDLFIQSEVILKEDPFMQPEVILKDDPIEQPVSLQPIVSENRRKVVFIREDKDNNNIWVVYKAPTKVDAMAFLSKITVDQPFYFVVVETPEGNYGRDKDGIYHE